MERQACRFPSCSLVGLLTRRKWPNNSSFPEATVKMCRLHGLRLSPSPAEDPPAFPGLMPLTQAARAGVPTGWGRHFWMAWVLVSGRRGENKTYNMVLGDTSSALLRSPLLEQKACSQYSRLSALQLSLPLSGAESTHWVCSFPWLLRKLTP